jgi:poly-gamma-glutamate synthesis protein (capsule biosynthesis protein)
MKNQTKIVNIVAVGDIMPGGLLCDNDQPCVNSDVLDILLKGDIRCGTLECAFGNTPTYDEAKVADRGNVIYAKDSSVKRLKELHIDLVSLANNHFYDLGTTGAEHTIELLDSEGILHCGAGRNLAEAGKPAIVEINEKTIAFLAFCDTDYNNVFYCTYATEDSPGVNPMKEDYVASEINRYSTKYDYVIVMAHWGTEHTFKPNISTDKMARLMLDSGACLVLGSHPHRVQPVINTRKGSIVYSMGNFLFPERLIAPPKVTYYPDAPIDYSTLPVTDAYPLVNQVTLKTLPFLARVGMIVSSELDGASVSSDYILSFLDEKNNLTLLDKERAKEIRDSFSCIHNALSLNLYGFYLMMIKYRHTIVSRFRKLIKG